MQQKFGQEFNDKKLPIAQNTHIRKHAPISNNDIVRGLYAHAVQGSRSSPTLNEL